ncbi:sigma-70 family RNA polymerase sigma factor [Actinokineospora sp. UTMC 2448]|uniref:sigma-70 family RNA polymerase sigma factor n=1 Tax=Actinokineospora sp. UTMC 2448 TaxID=2268449 RepID=UPI002164ED92|nr:sigma-70 family RNA polymerase sigma factor [Actinokineospora sp. UTMC 2448]UVS77747.1 putative RNA polymerase sigma factor FecI [Actinokineospora sp. UTMC 2448]
MGLVTVGNAVLAERFTEHRGHLLGVAYRLTGTIADAEDAVQDAWLRLSTVDNPAEIRDLRGWLTTVVGRLCLDRLRSAAVRRERYIGPWLPEPVVTPLDGAPGENPLDVVVRDDGVRMAALVVLDRLTPEQRVAFVLHDAFGIPYAEIASTLGCTEATARQHASRGRRIAADADPPPRQALSEQQEVLGRFLAALATGDVRSVVELLHPDAVFVGDSDGKARTARHRIEGTDKISRFLIGLLRQYGVDRLGELCPVLVNGDMGMALPDVPGPRPIARRVTAFAIRDGLVVGIYDVVNPDKLTRLPE